METRSYAVTILSGPENDPDDVFNPKCYPETYEEAVSIARPWVDQGYYAVIAVEKNEKEDEGEFIRIPLDAYRFVENLTDEQAGEVFKNINTFFFYGIKPECEDDVVRVATMQIIKRIREYTQDGK